MLSDKELRDIRADAAKVLGQIAVQLRRVPTSDGSGGETTSYATLRTIPCFVFTTTRPVEDLSTGKIVHRQVVNCLLDHEADVLATDRLQVGGKVYEIVALADADPFRGHKRAILERRDDDA